jgi:hypothetical protein
MSAALLSHLWTEADGILRQRYRTTGGTRDQRRFISLFGIAPELVAHVWTGVDVGVEPTTPVHLLWALMFLKIYSNETVHATLAGADEKTFRKWSWFWVSKLANLQNVRTLCITYYSVKCG